MDKGANVVRRYMQVRLINRRCQQVLRESLCYQASGVCVKALEFSTQLTDGNACHKHFDCNQATQLFVLWQRRTMTHGVLLIALLSPVEQHHFPAPRQTVPPKALRIGRQLQICGRDRRHCIIHVHACIHVYTRRRRKHCLK